MSWDFTVRNPPCRECGSEREYTWDGWAYNLGPMWRHAGISPGEFNKGIAKDWAPRFRAAVQDMETHPEVYRAMNPPNGRGNFDDFLPLLREFTDFLEKHPEATIHVS